MPPTPSRAERRGGAHAAGITAVELVIVLAIIGLLGLTLWFVAFSRLSRRLRWGGAALVGLPIVGLLIDGLAWWTPQAILGSAILVASLHILRRESSHERPVAVATRKPHMTRPAVAALAANGALTGAAQFLFLTHGLWLEDVYDLETAEVGLAVLAVGAVEVVATMGSSRLTDRLGKRRSIIGGVLVMTSMILLLAAVDAPPKSRTLTVSS